VTRQRRPPPAPPATAAGASNGSSLTESFGAQYGQYADTDHVFVETPSISAAVTNPTAGWSVGGQYLVDVVSAASVDIVSTASRRWQEVRQEGSLPRFRGQPERREDAPGAVHGTQETKEFSRRTYAA
jgi:hypothetical protein